MTLLRRLQKLANKRRQDLKNIGIESNIKQCKWPIGHVGTPEFHFCCEEAIPGRSPYCEKHTKIAYIQAPPKGLQHKKDYNTQTIC